MRSHSFCICSLIFFFFWSNWEQVLFIRLFYPRHQDCRDFIVTSILILIPTIILFTIYLYISISVSLSLSPCPTCSLSFPLAHSLSLSNSVSLPLYLSISHSISLYLSIYLSVYLSIYLSLSVSLCQTLLLKVSGQDLLFELDIESSWTILKLFTPQNCFVVVKHKGEKDGKNREVEFDLVGTLVILKLQYTIIY